MRYFILILCVFLCACDTEEPREESHAFAPRIVSVGQPYGPGTDYRIEVEFRVPKGWQCVAQDVDTYTHQFGTLTLTEAWNAPGRCWDVHTIKPGEYRTMRMYEADVDGATWANGYTQITGNPPGLVSGHHYAAYGYTGTVTRTGREVVWSIDARDASGIMVVIDGKSHWFKAP